MAKVPKHLKYTEDHFWCDIEDDSTVRIGITAFAAERLGEILSITLPAEGDAVEASGDCGELESEEKGSTELIAPLTGEVQAVNSDLIENPSLLVDDPWEDGWLFTLTPDDASEIKDLKTAEEYRELIEHLESEE
ncbi:MAG: glycine cleavage system protein GcvH [Deltaproteobacteria bacterium]|nr:glycine cleavage system protein GcvH [Deltaproteobacteria bacterium]